MLKKFIIFSHFLLILSIPYCASAENVKEELQALKDQVQILLNRIDTLEKNQKEQTSVKPVVEEPAMPTPSVPAKELPKPLVRSGQENVRLSVSGQVDRELLYGNNGTQSRIQHVDNNSYSSRMRFIGEGDVNSDLTIQSKLEGEFLSSSSYSVDITDAPAPESQITWTMRSVEAIFKSKKYGTLFVGRGPMASTDMSETDLSGTSVIALGGVADSFAGGFRFVDRLGNKGPQIAQVYSSMDGLDRTDRVRYDTPTFYGFFLGASHGGGEQSDFALKFANEYQGTKMQGVIAYGNSRPSLMKEYNGSASVLFPSGFSLTGAAGQQKFDNNALYKAYFGLGKIGYQHKWFDLGMTAMAVDYGQAWNITQNKDRSHLYGAFLVQQVEKLGIELYFGVRNHHLHRPNSSYQDILAIALGTRVVF